MVFIDAINPPLSRADTLSRDSIKIGCVARYTTFQSRANQKPIHSEANNPVGQSMQRGFDLSALGAQREGISELLESFRVALCHEPDGHDPRVHDMMKHVHMHLFRKSLSVEEIKEASRCRNNNIVTLFKRELETDIRHYIASMRLDAAAYVLEGKR